MQISTKLNGLAGRAAERLSYTVAEAWGQLRSRMEAARGSAGRRRRMRVVESLALGGRRQLLLVRCDEQEYLVGTGPDSVETIVLRQPGAAAEGAAALPAGAGQAPPAPATRKARSAGAGMTGQGASIRGRQAQGPWLVSAPEMGAMARGAMAKNRVRAGDRGQGLELWK